MKSSMGLLILGLAFVGYASASVYTDALGAECADKKEECHAFKHCCGDFQCFYPNGLNFLRSRKGECVECVDTSLKCQRDKQCCGYSEDESDGDGILCQKEHPMHLNGICSRLKSAGQKCYKDSQCATNDCVKKQIWHMYGKCSESIEI